MSDTNTAANAAELDEANTLEQSTITMLDVLEAENEMEEEYAAVLGASDEKACTYSKGAIQRQALYSCLTCCPEARNDLTKCAGICLACSYRCHEHHELIELYTKRNFRCDCPTLRLGSEKRCALNPQLDAVQPANVGNLYNQNFQGLYCNCKRPYPDPERSTEEMMLQCAVCEDWFHLQHMQPPAASEKGLDECSEMICDNCMESHKFLRDYSGLTLQQPTDLNDSATEVNVDDQPKNEVITSEQQSQLEKPKEKPSANEQQFKQEESKLKPTTSEQQEEPKNEPSTSQQLDEPPNKRAKVSSDNCRRPKTDTEHKGAAFWTNDWRKSLCQCTNCLELYTEQSVEFLLDTEDSSKAYEERGMKRAKESSSYEQGMLALASIGRTQQIDAITQYNRMEDKLKEYLQTFATSKKVVTKEDITRFFANMRNETPPTVGQPHFCR